MLLVALAVFAVLLIAAVVAVPLFKRLQLGSVIGYLAAGAAIGPFGLALVSEVERRADGTYRLRTPPTGASGALTVTLGTEPDAATFQTLRAFWRQAILTQPDKQFTRIDLRFERQIVTEEA